MTQRQTHRKFFARVVQARCIADDIDQRLHDEPNFILFLFALQKRDQSQPGDDLDATNLFSEGHAIAQTLLVATRLADRFADAPVRFELGICTQNQLAASKKRNRTCFVANVGFATRQILHQFNYNKEIISPVTSKITQNALALRCAAVIL